MNDFSDEINKILRLADVQLNEEQGYFTDWKSIKDKVVKMYIRSRLEETGMLEDDEWFIQQWIEDNASADMIEKIYDECGTTDIYWASAYINKNADAGGIITQVVKGMVGEYFDRISNDLQKEFEQNNLIYRMIDSDKSPKEIAQILKTNGTGNCWAKQEENAKAYYGGNNYNEYCLIGEATMDNVNWETTIFLRMMAEEENEVRLRKDYPIHIVGIKYYHYNEDNKLDKKDHMKVDMTLSVGHSYVFEESKQPIAETIKRVNEGFADTRLITTVAELDAYLRNNTETRVVYDKVKKWFLVGNSETSIHTHLLNDALADGYYEPFEHNGKTYTGKENEYEGGLWLHRLNPSRFILLMVSQDPLNSEEYYYDDYKYCYHYPNYCVFDRRMDFEQTPLFKYLGKPLEIENFGDFEDYGEDQYIDESIAYAEMNDDEMMVILHNPTRKELKDNNLDDECRIVNDGNGGYYFASSQWTHEQIENKLKSKNLPYEETMGEFYYYQDNLFATRDDWDTEEEYQEYKNDWYESLKSMPYIRNNFGNFKAEIFGGERLYEEIAYSSKQDLSDIILKNPTRNELREYNNVKEWRIIQDTEGNYYFGDAMVYIHSDLENALLKNGIDSVSADVDNYGIVFYSMPANVFYYRLLNLVNDEDIEKEYLKSYLPKAFPNSKLERSNDDDEDLDEQLNEEIIHAEKSNYDDYMAVVLKNPTKRELRENGLYRSRFICFEDGTWLFFDSMQWIHEQILSKYRSNSRSVGMGFYDYNTNEFIFMESMNHDEGEEGYDEEVSYYENKCKKWLLTKPYIRETFGLNPNVTVYGDWVDNPW